VLGLEFSSSVMSEGNPLGANLCKISGAQYLAGTILFSKDLCPAFPAPVCRHGLEIMDSFDVDGRARCHKKVWISGAFFYCAGRVWCMISRQGHPKMLDGWQRLAFEGEQAGRRKPCAPRVILCTLSLRL
jgi:hypothetical protein